MDKSIAVVSFASFLAHLIFDSTTLFYHLGLALLFIFLFVRPLDRILSTAWLKFALLLGTINNKVLLAIIWYTILTPLSLLKSFTRQNKRDQSANDSYWLAQDREIKLSDIGNIY